MISVFFDGVFVEEDGDEGGSGYGDQGSYDAGYCRAQEEGDEDGQAHEVDAGAHDAGGEEGVLQVDVEEVEGEDAEHLGPGVEGCDSSGEEDGEDSSCNGDDVEQAHEEAEEDEVSDVEEAEDDGAGEAQAEHEQALTEEPFAHLLVGSLEGGVEAEALGAREEGEEEAVGVFAFEHEVDTEEEG